MHPLLRRSFVELPSQGGQRPLRLEFATVQPFGRCRLSSSPDDPNSSLTSWSSLLGYTIYHARDEAH